MNKIFLFLTLVLTVGCRDKNKFDEGIYCLEQYISKDKFETGYMETFLIKVSRNEITYFGTVNTWGTSFKRNFADEKDQIINDSTILQKAFIEDHLIYAKFVKLKNAGKIIDDKGINPEEFSKYLNSNLIAGAYKNGNEKVILTKDGKIENLGNLKTFLVNPRFGTSWWYDYRTIKTNNELWKFEFAGDELIFTKYLKRNPEQEGKLSNLNIVLKR